MTAGSHREFVHYLSFLIRFYELEAYGTSPGSMKAQWLPGEALRRVLETSRHDQVTRTANGVPSHDAYTYTRRTNSTAPRTQ